MPLPDSEIIAWTRGYPTIDTNIPLGTDVIGTNLDDQFRVTKSVVREESLNKGWERWKGMYGVLSFVDLDKFSLTGDQRTSNGGPIEINRRVKAFVTAGTITGFIKSIEYNGTSTIATCTMDGITAFDNGLTEVQFGVRGEALPAGVTQVGLASPRYAVASGTDDYLATFSPPLLTFVEGEVLFLKIINANTTTTPTLNPDSLGAKTIIRSNGAAMAIGDLSAGMVAVLIYDGTNYQFNGTVSGGNVPGTIPVGSSGSVAQLGGVVSKQFSVGGIGNAAGGGNTVFFNHVFLPNSFDANGKFVRYNAFGTFVSNANNKFISANIAGDQIPLGTLTTSSASPPSWSRILFVMRVSQTQLMVTFGDVPFGTGNQLLTVPNMTTASISFQIRGASQTANQVLGNMYILEFFN